jgi:hypothetical protein
VPGTFLKGDRIYVNGGMCAYEDDKRLHDACLACGQISPAHSADVCPKRHAWLNMLNRQCDARICQRLPGPPPPSRYTSPYPRDSDCAPFHSYRRYADRSYSPAPPRYYENDNRSYCDNDSLRNSKAGPSRHDDRERADAGANSNPEDTRGNAELSAMAAEIVHAMAIAFAARRLALLKRKANHVYAASRRLRENAENDGKRRRMH